MRLVFILILATLFMTACSGVAVVEQINTEPPRSEPTETPTPMASPPSTTAQPKSMAAGSFSCSHTSPLTLGFTVWHSPSLNLDGLNELYTVPIDLSTLTEAEYSESDGYPEVLKMKGADPINYQSCQRTFTSDLQERIIDWSPSGDMMLVYETNGKCYGDNCPDFRSDLYILKTASGQASKIASLKNSFSNDLGKLDLRASFSPTGDRVAYIDGDDDNQGRRIMVMDLASNASYSLVTSENEDAIVTSMQWSPDGNSILFSRECVPDVAEEIGECSGIWSLAVEPEVSPSQPRFSPQQQYSLGEGVEPVWSPNEERVAFTNDEGIWVVAIDGTERRLVVPSCAGWSCGRARWSPDGEYLVVKHDSDDRQITGAYGDEVWVVRLNDETTWRVSPVLVEVSGPAQWSPDGEWVAYAGCSRWGCRPYVSKMDGSATILLPLAAPVESGSIFIWKPAVD